MRKILGLILVVSTSALGGSIGGSGGTPPAISVEERLMRELQDGVLRDELIHIMRPGHPDHFLLPNKDSLRSQSMSANDLETGDEVTFEVQQPVTKLQTEMALSITRIVPAINPGALSLEDLIGVPKPIVETVPVSKVPPELINKGQPTVPVP